MEQCGRMRHKVAHSTLRRAFQRVTLLATHSHSLLLSASLLFHCAASKQEKEIFRFSPNVIFFIVLPPIILDAGYTLKRRDFFQNLGTILLLAVTGTVLNCIVFGYILFGFAKVGWVPLDRTSPLESLLFGSIISATDPVATLAMLGSKEVNAHPLLYSLVFGESVLNDAIAIVLYKTFEGAMPDSEFTQGGSDETSFGATDLFKALGTFLGVSIGSVVMGVGIALVCCFIFKRIDFSKFPIYEFTLVSLFAYLSYFAAEMVELSGIMSLFFCSVCLAHYNYYNLSTNAQIATLECYKSLAQICETFVFCYLGITAGLSIQSTYLKWSIGMIVITILTCLVARAGNVFPICALANLGRKIKVPFKMQSQCSKARQKESRKSVAADEMAFAHWFCFFCSSPLSSSLVGGSSRRGVFRVVPVLPRRERQVRGELDAHARPVHDNRVRRPDAARAALLRHEQPAWSGARGGGGSGGRVRAAGPVGTKGRCGW